MSPSVKISISTTGWEPGAGQSGSDRERESLLNASTHVSNMYGASTMCQAAFVSPIAQFLADTVPVPTECAVGMGAYMMAQAQNPILE